MYFLIRLSFIFTALVGCRSLAPTATFTAKLVKISPLYNVTKIQSGCRLLDYDGNLVFNFNYGSLCIFENDGSTVAGLRGHLTKYDSELKILWQTNLRTHHQLNSSEFDTGYLTIIDYFYTEADKRLVRYDGLAVLDRRGKIIKSFDFRTLRQKFDSFKMVVAPPEAATPFGQAVDFTHVNSFIEYYKTVDGKKVLAGYIANDLRSQRLFFFDPNLSQVTRIIKMPRTSAHDYQQISEHSLLFYRNIYCFDNACQQTQPFSTIQLLNLQDESSEELYNNRDPFLMSPACSSVQPLGADHLFLFHSACTPTPAPKVRLAAMEIVDLKTKRGIVRTVKTPEIQQSIHAKLINADAYLKKIKFK